MKASLRAFSSTPVVAKGLAATPKKKRQRYRDQYSNRLAESRRTANIDRQAELNKQRTAAAGDPIRGIVTPFVESFDTALPPPSELAQSSSTPSDQPPASTTATVPELQSHLNHLLTPYDVITSLRISEKLSKPYIPADRTDVDPTMETRAQATHQALHANAAEAVARIVSLRNANSRDRTRANVQRCISTFGRHHTDGVLAPRAPSALALDPAVHHPEPTPRAGPDTGSSEVQIAILTAKIRVLAGHYEAESKNDKVNKRNLRLLLHRRQKLLKYMHRKERGSGRWQFMVETLGLTEATWKGQIAVE
jgi:ribosomal protein S15